ncbi:NAD-P-binding protein [Amanita muscaria]
MSQGKVKFFITGATGYIGGSVLAQLLKHPKRDLFEYTALVRSPEKAEKLKEFGVKTVIGSFTDEDVLTEQASKVDVVFSLASADHLLAMKAILKGMKQQYERTGVTPILIHTSGIGTFAEDAHGMHAIEKVVSDLDVQEFDQIPRTRIHREVDLAALEGDKHGYVKTHIIYPGTIWGIADHELAKAGISNWHSDQIPALIRASLDRKRAGVVGEGKNVWNDVHWEDVATLYTTLFDAIEAKNELATHGREGTYIAENGYHTMYQVAQALQQAFIELGISKETEPTPFTREELQKYFGNDYLGTNALCKGERSRLIGWKPQKTTEELLASIKTEVERKGGPITSVT